MPALIDRCNKTLGDHNNFLKSTLVSLQIQDLVRPFCPLPVNSGHTYLQRRNKLSRVQVWLPSSHKQLGAFCRAGSEHFPLNHRRGLKGAHTEAFLALGHVCPIQCSLGTTSPFWGVLPPLGSLVQLEQRSPQPLPLQQWLSGNNISSSVRTLGGTHASPDIAADGESPVAECLAPGMRKILLRQWNNPNEITREWDKAKPSLEVFRGESKRENCRQADQLFACWLLSSLKTRQEDRGVCFWNSNNKWLIKRTKRSLLSTFL